MLDAVDTVTVEVATDNSKSTIATVVLERGFGDAYDIEFQSASAVKHPDDKFDAEVAYLLAVGRALQFLGRKLERRGNGLCKHNDDMRARMAEQKAAAKTKNTRKKK